MKLKFILSLLVGLVLTFTVGNAIAAASGLPATIVVGALFASSFVAMPSGAAIMAININQALIDAGIKYEKEIRTFPMLQLERALKYMTLRTGLQGKVIGGALTTDGELRPYRTAKDPVDNTQIIPYEWEVFLGDVVKEFDPYQVLGTLYTEKTATKSDDMKIARLVALEMAKSVGQALYNAMFKAERAASGNTTMDLFNGFSTQIAAKITSGELAVAKGNYVDLSATPMTAANIGDLFLQEVDSANEILAETDNLNLYGPSWMRRYYEAWFQAEYGHTPWNPGIEQKVIAGADNINMVPLSNMVGQDYMILTTKQNMLVGVDQESDKERVEIRRPDNPKLVQLFMMAYFGVGFDNLDSRFIKVIKIAKG